MDSTLLITICKNYILFEQIFIIAQVRQPVSTASQALWDAVICTPRPPWGLSNNCQSPRNDWTEMCPTCLNHLFRLLILLPTIKTIAFISFINLPVTRDKTRSVKGKLNWLIKISFCGICGSNKIKFLPTNYK